MQQFPKLTCRQIPITTTADRVNAATIRFLRRTLVDTTSKRDQALARAANAEARAANAEARAAAAEARAAAADARAAALERQLADLRRGRKRKHEGTSNMSIPSFRLY